ncbi:MAG: neuraminidase-like domain-containing protein [Rhodobacter sp.]|nr:neuraminidase-like domain-containing protein [Rhodobacter sp.]
MEIFTGKQVPGAETPGFARIARQAAIGTSRAAAPDKRALRRNGRARRDKINFAQLAEEPLYQRIAALTCPASLKAKIDAFGFDTAARVAAFPTVDAVNVAAARDGSAEARKETAALMREARREALRSYRLMRLALAMKDPMNQALRYTRSNLTPEFEQALVAQDAQAYADPSSLQSAQSPAAYLRHLYRIATGLDQAIGIRPPAKGPYRLEARRPDLARLALSETHLKQEMPTIALVNEVLTDALGEVDFTRSFCPVALPFDDQAETTRISLGKTGGATLNSVYAETRIDQFPLSGGFRLAWDQAGLLGLTGNTAMASGDGSEVSLLCEGPGNDAARRVPTLGGLYDVEDTASASAVPYLRSILNLDFGALVQLLGLYVVEQEGGGVLAQADYATAFLGNTQPFDIEGEGDARIVQINGAPLGQADLRSLNYLARLHHGTGLAFHQLNWILALPGASAAVDSTADADTLPRRHVTQTGLRLLAGFAVLQESFNLKVDEYAALFGTICPYWRSGIVLDGDESVAGLEQTEISFLRQLFGPDAPALRATLAVGSTPVTDADLATVLKRGLGLTTVELGVLTEALDPAFAVSSGLDDRGLGGLYRLRTVFRMLGWPILEGMRLVARVSGLTQLDTGLWTALVGRNDTPEETGALCDALDQLIGLSQWMASADISPDTLLFLLSDTPETGLRASDEDRAWLERFAALIGAAGVTAALFSGSDIWDAPDGRMVQISLVDLVSHLSQEGGLLDSNGIFRDHATRAEIVAALDGFLAQSQGIDLGVGENATRLSRLATKLERGRDAQLRVLEGHVASLSSGLNEAGAGPLILWAQTTGFELIHRFSAGPEDQGALHWLRELRRHAGAVDALGLGDVELWMIANTPHWLAPGSGDPSGPAPLKLGQLFHLRAFATIQVGAASDAAWRGYLALANEGWPQADAPPEEFEIWRAACIDAMAILLGAPTEDALTLVEAIVGPGAVATDIATVECVARHLRLAQDLCIGASDLLALKEVANSDKQGDWAAAAAAAQAGLSGFKDGDQVAAFENAYAEVRRDALVGTYMRSIVAPDTALAREVTDTEQLYRYLLLDVNVTSAVPTSRLVEAISSLQLYIDRALSGDEPGVEFRDRSALSAQWKLDKQYRQWEANQKLLLYPQNYIEPDLRYITSPQFEELLQAVSGKDLTEDAVETAVNTYMAGVAKCCDLSLCSLYVDRHRGGAVPGDATYHLLARAQWEPGRFFYRKLEADFKTIAELNDPSHYLKALDWTFWQEVVIPKTHEIFSDVTVCFFRNRYYVFWLELEERRKQLDTGEEVSWFLHPRYMRCDNNALTGPMHTPALFAETMDGVAPFAIDGAFVWKGARPELTTTYHPATLTGMFSFGSGQVRESETETRDVMHVTFGLALTDLDGTRRETALQLRLATEWSDAILIGDANLDTSIDEAAPARYDSVFPRPRSEDACVADTYTVTVEDAISLTESYYTTNVSIETYWSGGDETAIVFHPSVYDSDSLGSFAVDINLGDRVYVRRLTPKTGPDAYGVFEHVQEIRPVHLKLEIELSYRGPDGEEDSFTGTLVGRQTPIYIDDIPDMKFNQSMTASTLHLRDERLSGTIELPKSWRVAVGKETRITVTTRIEAIFPPMVLTMTFGGVTQYREAQPKSGDGIVDAIGTPGQFVLRARDVKQDTGWALEGAHGSRNFIHVFSDEQAPIAESFLLLNSSSAIERLAETMPRPGGCETLFQWENQLLVEDLGTFVPAFEETLAKVYPEDSSNLDPARAPTTFFDFDAAYGGYGWEIFYHIPAAIAAGYARTGRYDDALAWLAKIFDPQADAPWRVVPLVGAIAPEDGLGFDTGEVIIDPDRIAQDYPFYYQQATIRQYLEVMIAAGDAAYKEQTQETLQTAKSIYLAAKQFFRDELSETLEILGNQPWGNPTLGEASADGFTGFLPPYNQEMRDLYDVIETRLAALRQWLDIDGQPMSVPLLEAPIDPRQLQLAGKAAQTLRSAEYEDEEEPEARLDFMTVARSAKQYIANLKTTSSRLQANLEKGDSAVMAALLREQSFEKAGRSSALQELVIATAQKEVEVKEANLAGASAILTNHVANVLVDYGLVFAAHLIKRGYLIGRVLVSSVMRGTYRIAGLVKSGIPVIYGFSNGGANIPMGDVISVAAILGQTADDARLDDDQREAIKNSKDLVELTAKTVEYSTKVATARAELEKAKASLTQEKRVRANLARELEAAQAVKDAGARAFGTAATYDAIVTDLQALMAEEWSVTQDFCKLLARLYNDETGETNGGSFLRTTSLGSGIEQLNAPYRLALDVERLEAAYIRSILQQDSQISSVQFALSEVQDLGGERSVVEALAAQGEAYFELTDEMFDTLYPGQFDRRIQSVRIAFAGLAEAGLNPHARLVQIANTRCTTRERDAAKGARLRKDRHALQSVVIGKPEFDTAALACADGQLKRFQNTGVQSRWHLSMPSVVELLQPQSANGRNTSWRDAASRHFEAVKPHLDEIEFEVSFAGRW